MLHSGYVYAIEDVLIDINRNCDTRIELHASWCYPIWTNEGASLLFRLRDVNGNRDRLMELIVQKSDFRIKAGPEELTESAKKRITSEIEYFFRGSVRSLQMAVSDTSV